MKCPRCRGVSLPVIETRRGPSSVYRRRKCKRCDTEVVTEEVAAGVPQIPRFDKRVGAHTPR